MFSRKLAIVMMACFKRTTPHVRNHVNLPRLYRGLGYAGECAYLSLPLVHKKSVNLLIALVPLTYPSRGSSS